MANNKYFIEQAKEIERLKKRLKEVTEENVANVYSAIALCLSDVKYGWDSDKIEELFADTQALWNDSNRKGISMPDWCEELTGICVATSERAERENLIEQ